MRIRTRKLVGAAALLVLVVMWPMLMVALGHSRIAAYYAPAQLVFYIVLGLVWLIPAALLIRWMQRPDRESD